MYSASAFDSSLRGISKAWFNSNKLMSKKKVRKACLATLILQYCACPVRCVMEAWCYFLAGTVAAAFNRSSQEEVNMLVSCPICYHPSS